MEDRLNKRSGIYTIINIVNSKIYVGSSVDLGKRKSRHFCSLRKNTHSNKYLQDSFIKYGEESFLFKVIEFVDREHILEREQYWIDKLNVCDKNCGYNLSPIATSYYGSKLYRGRPRKVINLDTGIVFDSINDALLFYDIRANTNIIKVCKGIRRTAGGYRWAYINNEDIDYVEYEQLWFRRKVINLDTGDIFDTIKDASIKYNLFTSGIRRACKSRNSVCGGYKWAYLTDDGKIIDHKHTVSKNKQVINLDNLHVFESIKCASKHFGISRHRIGLCCKGKIKTAGGFHWTYYEDYLKLQDIDNEDIL